jgi:hypothetical protein
MVDLLLANNVINQKLEWTFETGHLVIVGDMVDRGTNVVPLLWLIYKLEAEAKLAGGKLHYVLGNHEKYLLNGIIDSAADKYYGTFRSTDMNQRELWSEKTVLGRWLRSKPALLKVGDNLFVHGGISPEVLKTKPTLDSIDKELQNSFVKADTKNTNIASGVLDGSRGLLFYRGLAKDMSIYNLGGKAGSGHVDQILSEFGVKRIAIGHTLANHIGFDYDGRVIRVDVAHTSGVSEALLIENSSLYRVNTNGERFPLEQVSNITAQ